MTAETNGLAVSAGSQALPCGDRIPGRKDGILIWAHRRKSLWEAWRLFSGHLQWGLPVSVIIKRLFKKEIPLYGNTYVPLLGITLDDRDKKLLLLAGISFGLCIFILVVFLA